MTWESVHLGAQKEQGVEREHFIVDEHFRGADDGGCHSLLLLFKGSSHREEAAWRPSGSSARGSRRVSDNTGRRPVGDSRRPIACDLRQILSGAIGRQNGASNGQGNADSL